MLNYLSDEMHLRLLGRKRREVNIYDLKQSRNKLAKYDVDELEDTAKPIDIYIPEEIPTVVECIDLAHKDLNVNRVISRLDHFSKVGIPSIPTHLPKGTGWFEWGSGQWERSKPPVAITGVFDFETVEIDNKIYPVCCGVVSENRWWLWLWEEDNKVEVVDWGRNSLLIGHSVSYDRSFLKPEYNRETTGCLFPDTLAMWYATHGFADGQRSLVNSDRDELGFTPDWLEETGNAGLDDVYKFFTGIPLDKGVVKMLVKGGLDWLHQDGSLESLLWYNLKDIAATYTIFTRLWPEYRRAYHNPQHPLLGELLIYSDLLHGKSWMPVSPSRFPTWYTENENRYQEVLAKVSKALQDLAEGVLASRVGQAWLNGQEVPDPDEYEQQLLSLDWRPVKKAVHREVVEIPSCPDFDRLWTLSRGKPHLRKRLKKIAKGEPNVYILKRIVPKWYGDNCVGSGLTMGTRITPLLMGCTWQGTPLRWDNGWMFGDEKVPHPDKQGQSVHDLFMQGMGTPIRNGVLKSRMDTSEVMKMLASIRLWTSFRKRFSKIRAYNNVWLASDSCSVGTVSFRMKGTMMLLPNYSKDDKHKLGCSVKSLFEAPTGEFVGGADFDSQELRIACSLGDAKLGAHGMQPGSTMQLMGNKEAKTTMHWKLAIQAGIDYVSAKGGVYGAIYRIGVNKLANLFISSNPTLDRTTATAMAENTLDVIKGKRGDYGVYYGGLLSDTFNELDRRAKAPIMSSIICGRKISKALRHLGKDFMTTRVNWLIQSAGSDQRSLLVVWMHWLLKNYKIDARLMTPIHDEVRYSVKSEHRDLFNWALQLAHLMVQAFTVDALGLDGITASQAYFPEVDVARVLTKSVKDTYETVCNPVAISPGYVLKPDALENFIPDFAHIQF